jgi:hypothetical protein
MDLQLAGARLWGSETPIIKAVLLPLMWRRLELAADPKGRPGIASYRTDAAHLTLLPDPDPQECLDGFLALQGGSAVARLRFAQKWGERLWECHDHRLPPDPNECQRCDSRLPGQTWGEGWEPLSEWDALTDQYVAVLRLAADLDAGTPTREADWRVISQSLPEPASPYPRTKSTVADYVSVQLQLGNVWPDFFVDPTSGRWEFALDSLGLRALLAVGLATVLNCGGMYRCDACGLPFKVAGRRRRRTGPNGQPVRNYCPPPRSCAATGRNARARERYTERKSTARPPGST